MQALIAFYFKIVLKPQFTIDIQTTLIIIINKKFLLESFEYLLNNIRMYKEQQNDNGRYWLSLDHFIGHILP